MTKADGKGTWWEGLDPADLYGLPPKKRTPGWIKTVKHNWMLRHIELIEKYEVDLLWFDGHNFPYGTYGRRVGERFYNNSLKRDGKINVVLAGKPYGLSKHDQKGWVKDFERGVPDEPLGRPFQSIITIRSWFYKQDHHRMEPRHSARTLVEIFSDVLSKGGNLLLNMELTGDGRLPPDLKHIYDDFGSWVKLNADAIYASQPWKTFCDNRPQDLVNRRNLDETNLKQAKQHSGQFNERTVESPPYPHDEVRYVTRKDKLYIFVLNPKAGPIQLPALGLKSRHNPGMITGIRMFNGDTVKFTQNADKLTLEIPAERPNQYTTIFEVIGAITEK
jgi:alpha-L-fucosidase